MPESAISTLQIASDGSAAATTSAVFTHHATTKDQVFNPTNWVLKFFPCRKSAIKVGSGDYVQMMVPLASEAPEQFHLAAGLGLVAATAGRRVSNYFLSSDLYANLYIYDHRCHGESRKDTAIKFATRLLDDNADANTIKHRFKLITDVGRLRGSWRS